MIRDVRRSSAATYITTRLKETDTKLGICRKLTRITFSINGEITVGLTMGQAASLRSPDLSPDIWGRGGMSLLQRVGTMRSPLETHTLNLETIDRQEAAAAGDLAQRFSMSCCNVCTLGMTHFLVHELPMSSIPVTVRLAEPADQP